MDGLIYQPADSRGNQNGASQINLTSNILPESKHFVETTVGNRVFRRKIIENPTFVRARIQVSK